MQNVSAQAGCGSTSIGSARNHSMQIGTETGQSLMAVGCQRIEPQNSAVISETISPIDSTPSRNAGKNAGHMCVIHRTGLDRYRRRRAFVMREVPLYMLAAALRRGVKERGGKIYLASIVIHDNAYHKLELLQRGECKHVLTIEEGQFPDYDWDWEEKGLCAVLGNVDWSRVRFICVEREHPLLSPLNLAVSAQDRKLLGEFLCKYGGDSTLTTSYLDGHHAFFYGAPNSLPKILFLLFSRVEDLTIYPMEHFLGNFPSVTRLDIDDDAA